MLLAIILQLQAWLGEHYSIKAQPQIVAFAVDHLDVVIRSAEAVVEGVTRPASWQQRLNTQGIASTL
ncbi:hypothetical protein D3C79_1116230 [compost metagenome]